MDPFLSAFLLSWDLRVEVVAILILAGSLYTWGWRRIQRRNASQRPLATRWRLAAYLGGLTILGVALMSPIDVWGGQLFFMHMIQHLLLVMIVPPLLLLANPLGCSVAAQPSGAVCIH
jgi:cytochrome c oxidase assembly factor CtaG